MILPFKSVTTKHSLIKLPTTSISRPKASHNFWDTQEKCIRHVFFVYILLEQNSESSAHQVHGSFSNAHGHFKIEKTTHDPNHGSSFHGHLGLWVCPCTPLLRRPSFQLPPLLFTFKNIWFLKLDNCASISISDWFQKTTELFINEMNFFNWFIWRLISTCSKFD